MPKLTKTIDRGDRDWYQLQRWRNKRAAHLRESPLCVMCQAKGKIVPATIADHVIPHHGDWNAFWLGELQSLCGDCHQSDKRSIEHGREPKPEKLTFGVDGWPIEVGS